MSEHEHKFNATRITTMRERILRCTCGAWTSATRLREGGPPFAASTAKGLDTRLAKASEWEENWVPEQKKQEHSEYNPDSTPAVDDVLRGKRRS